MQQQEPKNCCLAICHLCSRWPGSTPGCATCCLTCWMRNAADTLLPACCHTFASGRLPAGSVRAIPTAGTAPEARAYHKFVSVPGSTHCYVICGRTHGNRLCKVRTGWLAGVVSCSTMRPPQSLSWCPTISRVGGAQCCWCCRCKGRHRRRLCRRASSWSRSTTAPATAGSRRVRGRRSRHWRCCSPGRAVHAGTVLAGWARQHAAAARPAGISPSTHSTLSLCPAPPCCRTAGMVSGDLPPRSSLAATGVEGGVVVFGGATDRGERSDELALLSVARGKLGWRLCLRTAGATWPKPRGAHTAEVVGGRIYCAGGYGPVRGWGWCVPLRHSRAAGGVGMVGWAARCALLPLQLPCIV